MLSTSKNALVPTTIYQTSMVITNVFRANYVSFIKGKVNTILYLKHTAQALLGSNRVPHYLQFGLMFSWLRQSLQANVQIASAISHDRVNPNHFFFHAHDLPGVNF
jgi:hypothetical protein